MYTYPFFFVFEKSQAIAWGRPRCHLSKDLRKWAGEHLSEARTKQESGPQLGMKIRYVKGGPLVINK